MRNRITKVLAGLAALAALALGGASLASGQGTVQANRPATAAQHGSAKADAEKSDSPTAGDTDSIQDENGKDDATEPSAAEQNSSSEAAETETGSEVAGNDGPGGHADEPGNPTADHQFEGQE